MTIIRGVATGSLLLMVAAILVPPPVSLVLFGAAVVTALALIPLRPRDEQLADYARRANRDPNLVTLYDAAEMCGLSTGETVLALDRAGVPRADASHGAAPDEDEPVGE